MRVAMMKPLHTPSSHRERRDREIKMDSEEQSLPRPSKATAKDSRSRVKSTA